MISLHESQLDDALKLAEEFGDGDAGIAYKREKDRWYALLFFDLSSERLGYVERGWGDTPEEALELLLERVTTQAANKRKRKADKERDAAFKTQSVTRTKEFIKADK